MDQSYTYNKTVLQIIRPIPEPIERACKYTAKQFGHWQLWENSVSERTLENLCQRFGEILIHFHKIQACVAEALELDSEGLHKRPPWIAAANLSTFYSPLLAAFASFIDAGALIVSSIYRFDLSKSSVNFRAKKFRSSWCNACKKESESFYENYGSFVDEIMLERNSNLHRHSLRFVMCGHGHPRDTHERAKDVCFLINHNAERWSTRPEDIRKLNDFIVIQEKRLSTIHELLSLFVEFHKELADSESHTKRLQK